MSKVVRSVKHTATAKTREEVAICKMANMKHAVIAASLGLSVRELERVYKKELEETSAAKMRELVVVTYRRAMGGSTAAVKNMVTLFGDRAGGRGGSGGYVSKKMLANQSAETAHEGTKWDDLLSDNAPPRAN